MSSEFTFLPEDQDENELWIAQLAPRPQNIAATGLSAHFLADLVEKHLFEGGVLPIRELARRIALSGNILDEVLQFLRKEGRMEVRSLSTAGDQGLAYALTERGRGSALAALAGSGYIGPAPIPLESYKEITKAQSIRLRHVSRQRLENSFADTVIDPSLLERLGPALNSGKAMFVYGHPGTGKTYITKRLTKLFDDACLIPHALLIGNTVLRVYDPSVHKPVRENAVNTLLQRGHDPRYVMCKRPVVLTGGELNAEMLEVQYDVNTRQFRAPLQLKANGGMFILDDLGRQRVAPAVVLNRWIVPMEDSEDYLTLTTGEHFQVPFDLLLVFSTNLKPEDLADEAFLRRIGYKIRFRALKPVHYHAIWRSVCEANGVDYDPTLCQFVIDELHQPTKTPLLPCHPGDLVEMAVERMEYIDSQSVLTKESLRWAWKNYFVNSETDDE